MELKFTSWKYRGLQKPKKIKQVMNKLKDINLNIVFLQETHTLAEDNVKIARRWQGNIYATSFTSQVRGLMTLISRSVPFKVSNVIKDKFGRYLIIQGSLLSRSLYLVYVYGPNTD